MLYFKALYYKCFFHVFNRLKSNSLSYCNKIFSITAGNNAIYVHHICHFLVLTVCLFNVIFLDALDMNFNIVNIFWLA